MHSYKMKISRSLLEALDEFIKLLIKLKAATNDEKLFVAVMAQVGALTDDKISMYKPVNPSYILKLNTAQMFAMVVLAEQYIHDHTTYLGNYLQTQSLKIQQQTA